MKKYFFLQLCVACGNVFFTYNSFSQAYHPMPIENAVWREYYVDNPIDAPNLFNLYEYYLDGDTFIGNYFYQRVRYYGIFTSGDTIQNNEQFFYRQDTINKKVYIQNFFYPFNDTLIYNFDIQLGDTLSDMLFMPPSNSTDYFVRVDSIDSIETPIGFLRRFRLLSTIIPWGYGYWIEGIGNINGFFGPPLFLPFDPYGKIICFRQNDTTIYDAPVAEADCDSLYVGMQEVKDETEFQVYPSLLRAGELINITYDSQSELALLISDVYSRKIAQLRLAPGFGTTTFRFDKPGIYFVACLNQNDIPSSSIIIVTP